METKQRRPRVIGVLSLEDMRVLGAERVKRFMRLGFIPTIAGAQTTYGDAIVNPLGPPTVSGTQVTVDFLLNNPTRVTRVIADLVMRNFFLDRVFATGGDVQGGAVLYDQPTYLDVYTNRDVEQISPGNEFPILTGVRVAPLVAVVQKFGGKFPVTDEARRRNNIGRVTNQMRRVANTIVRKMNQRGIAEMNAVVAATSRTFTSISWGTATTQSLTTATPASRPLATLAAARHEAEMNEAGYVYDTMIIHPDQMQQLVEVYGTNLDQALSANGIEDLIATPRATTGTALIMVGQGVGELRLEEPLNTVTEYEGAPELRQQTWIQTSVNPVLYVTDPYAIIQATGLT